MSRLYYKYSEYLANKYGQKIYKIPLNISSNCPNRDGTKSFGGCIFCAPDGSGHENMPKNISIEVQYESIKKILIKKYKAQKYIAYFQSYSNTYMPMELFKYNMDKAAQLDGCVALSISTRPDCIQESHINFLTQLKEKYKKDICIEIGMQSSNDNTLEILNRNHTIDEVIKSSHMVKKAGLELCVHIIVDMPWDGRKDIIKDAKIINDVKCDSVKVHSLYIAKDTYLEKMYKEGKLKLLSIDEYIDRVILLLENINKDIAIQRLISRVTPDKSVICTWNQSWRKVLNMIENEMVVRGTYQGKNIL